MKRLKTIAAAGALAAAMLGLGGTAQATTFMCDPAPGICSFDGTTGGFANVKRSAGQSAADTFKITFASAGTAVLTFTTAHLQFVTATFDGVTFTPVSGADNVFKIAAAGTYDLVMTVANPTSRVASYSGTIDFAAVPEPATWGMMIGGLGVAGASLRRRRMRVAAIA
ncbi:FxDxF family PEP-CTERM protein [Sphingomonas sp. RS6]